MISQHHFKPLLGIAFILGATNVNAHETWVSPVLLIQLGEPHEEHLDSYHPNKISLLSAMDHRGKNTVVKAKHIGDSSVIVQTKETKMPAAIFYTIAYDPYIIKGEEWIKSTLAEIEKAEKCWVGSYTSTSIQRWNEHLTKSRSRSIEIVPQSNPADLKKGELLHIIIFSDGKPLEGAEINLTDKKKITSDDRGRIAVPIKGGHQIIIASSSQTIGKKTIYAGAALSFNHVSRWP